MGPSSSAREGQSQPVLPEQPGKSLPNLQQVWHVISGHDLLDHAGPPEPEPE